VKAEQAASTLSTVLRPATGVRLFLTRDEGILFDEVGQKLFHLNSMATCIWCYIEETHSIESIIHSTAHSMHLDMDRARHFVLKMIRAWRRLGLLQGGRHRPGFRRRGLPLRRRALRLMSTDESDSALQAQLHFYQLLDVKFSLAYGQRSLEALIHPILAHLELSRPPSEALRLEIDRTGEEWRVLHGSKVPGSCRGRACRPWCRGSSARWQR
jgi:Coenzyme PQQ synthesis protein D (PqqD)